MPQSFRPYPMLIEASMQTRIWGGRQLETRLGKKLPTDQPYGESWEIFWQNRIANGLLAGKTLGEAVELYPVAMTGNVSTDAEFPLLVKFLDAQDWLSVQVHPDDSMALQLEGQPRGKTECWYVVDAVPGSKLAYGLSEQLDAVKFRAAVESGRAKEIMQYVPVAPGDFVYVPAGTQHAIGAGILIYELQQTSDTTYRVYDWDRVGLDGNPRELHLEKALAVTQYTVKPPAKVAYKMEEKEGYNVGALMRGQFFALDKLVIQSRCKRTTEKGGELRAHLLTVVAGSVTLRTDAGDTLDLPLGTSAFIPAGCASYDLIGPNGPSTVLEAWPQ